jgi:exodeoxyribonuclease V alpha subunit
LEATQITITLDESQQAAVRLMTTESVAIVTGGPGTGKTTCLRHALDVLDAKRWTYALAAPTGKAAKRMHETTGRRAQTIHRLLAYRPGVGFTINAHNPIDADIVIVDESSMIDIELGAALLEAINPGRTHLILIGDSDQLPPVGPGRLFGDLVEAEAVPIARLTTLHRSALDSWIHVNAPRVLKKVEPDLTERHDFRFVEVADAADILRHVRELVTETRSRKVADVQVLIPQRNGSAGIDAANRVLQDALNPRTGARDETFIVRRGSELRAGDRVIQTRNDYGLGVFNGEVGEILTIASGKVLVEYDGNPVEYTLEQAEALQHAYALTVHRAQGSEFPWVIMVCHSTHTRMLTQQLLYTAITRGKRGVILVGDRKGIRAAVSDTRAVKRNTTLIERLNGEIEDERQATRDP